MAEAGPSEADTANKAEQSSGQNVTDKASKTFSQSNTNSKGRQANFTRSTRPKPKKDRLEAEGIENAFAAKPIKRRSKGRRRQNTRSQEKIAREIGQSTSNQTDVTGEESKSVINSGKDKSSVDDPGSMHSASRQGRKVYPKSNKNYNENRMRSYSSRNQQPANYSHSKQGNVENLALDSRFGARSHSDISALLPVQKPTVMLSGTKKLFTSHGVVSDGIYVPNDNSTINNQPCVHGNLHLPKRFVSSYYIRDPSKHTSYNMGKLNANFQAISVKSQGQSSVQAGVLIEQLTDEKYECMVCCEVIRCAKAVWSCSKCFHIFHLYCIKRWARSPAAAIEDDQGRNCGWRCPACQHVDHSVPNAYRCFCGKVEGPKWYPQDGITPHSCGELCLKKRIGKDCVHPCNQLCHPGPCPSCPVTITKKCCCGKTTISVRCGNSSSLTCSLTCGKTLNCGVHQCQEKCHSGCCESCTVPQEQSCYCGQSKTEAVCGHGSPTYIDGKAGYFSCGAVCSKKLDCGNHECQEVCHPSQCRSCERQPDVITTCPCGKMSIVQLLNRKSRSSCLDPIPTCGYTCDGFLPCAKYNEVTKGSSEHRCKKLCHHGDCSTCDGDSIIKCRCRATSKKMKCIELNMSGEPYMCERKCNKKFDCGRHRCSQKCCPGTEHKCTLTCGKKLKCGKHKCMEPCHSGTCPPCLMAGFDEVFCPCGATVQEPPIPCGKPPPVCHRRCSRIHQCEHEVEHNCHYEEQCPPCTMLVSKWCMGKHKQRHNIPCHVDSVSCGELCGKILPCGKHKCLKGCHKPPCFEEDESCKQACISPRESCGHPCGAQCHEGECPNIPCKSKVRIYCPCGRKSEDAVCLKGGDKMDVTQAYQRFTTKNLAEKIKGLQGGQTVDISDLMNLDERRSRLDCDDECARQQRNRALAEALGIYRPDTPSKPEVVQYPHFVEEHGRTNMKFVYFVEDALDNLVKNVAKVQSQQLTHSFAPMNNKNRRFIHELATMYGCSSISYDQEPNRNTVVTANKDSRCPRIKLSSQIQRQMNPQPPPPVPVLPEHGIGNVKFIERRKSVEMDAVDYFAGDF